MGITVEQGCLMMGLFKVQQMYPTRPWVLWGAAHGTQGIQRDRMGLGLGRLMSSLTPAHAFLPRQTLP